MLVPCATPVLALMSGFLLAGCISSSSPAPAQPATVVVPPGSIVVPPGSTVVR